MQRVQPYHEDILLPAAGLKARGFISTMMEHTLVHPHWHTEVEVLCYLDGPALQQVNDRYFTAEAGDIVVIACDQLHSTYTVGREAYRILVLQFDADGLLGPQTPEGSYGSGVVYENPIRLPEAPAQQLMAALREALEELDRREAGYEHIVRGSLCRFIGFLDRWAVRTHAATSPEDMSGTHDMLRNTFQLVDAAFAEQITLAQAAAASSLSVTHFCRLFRRATGMTFHDYLTFYRVNRAQQMLPAGHKLSQIAFDCGFGSVSSFIRNFRKYKNCSPSQLDGRRGAALR